MTVYVNFKDETQKEIACVFSSPQSDEWYQNLGEVDEGDERLKAFFSLFPANNGPVNAA